MFPLSARTQTSETVHTHKFAAHRHIIVDYKIIIIRQTMKFLGTKTAPIQAKDLSFFFGLHVISDTNTASFLGADLLFGLHLISDIKTALILSEFPEVSTRQNFCAHQRAQKIRGNIGCDHSSKSGKAHSVYDGGRTDAS